jgi:5-(carboxyamino)imidazole ribonucleotide mutase
MKIGIVMGSDSDFPVVKKCLDVLHEFGVDMDVRVLSAHRTPHQAVDFAMNACDEGIEVLIAAAGKAAHLAGVLAGVTHIPVIGIPIKSSTMDGLDSLLSMVQMPSGVPVATVAIDGAQNAGLLAIQMLSIKYETLRDKLKVYKQNMEQDVLSKNKNIQEKVKELY